MHICGATAPASTSGFVEFEVREVFGLGRHIPKLLIGYPVHVSLRLSKEIDSKKPRALLHTKQQAAARINHMELFASNPDLKMLAPV